MRFTNTVSFVISSSSRPVARNQTSNFPTSARSFTITGVSRKPILLKWDLPSASKSVISGRVPYRIAATWLTRDPANVRPQHIVRRLPQLDHDCHLQIKRLIFLVTPAFAKWFEDDETFLTLALNRIYGKFRYTRNARDIECSVAVVDRLPSPMPKSTVSHVEYHSQPLGPDVGHEGIALWADSLRFEPDLMTSSDGNDPDEQLIRATFHVPRSLKCNSVLSIELRPANTLFVNGAQSTMWHHRWRFDTADDGTVLTRVDMPRPLRTLEVYFPKDTATLDVTLEALTPCRKIVSSMGNVVRQVQGHKDDELLSASAELEEKVPQFLARAGQKSGTLRIFALVSPSKLIDNQANIGGLIEPSETDLAEAEKSWFQKALLAGAHLHRVTSGGGGWGKKQGLLSLDPAFDLSTVQDTGSLDHLFEQSEPGSDESALNAVTPGDYVQFFAKFDPDQHSVTSTKSLTVADVNTSVWEGRSWTTGESHSIQLGILPSRDDPIKALPPDHKSRGGVIGIPNQFGLLSEGGMCLRSLVKVENSDKPSSIEFEQNAVSRIDVPYGVWRADLENRSAVELERGHANVVKGARTRKMNVKIRREEVKIEKEGMREGEPPNKVGSEKNSNPIGIPSKVDRDLARSMGIGHSSAKEGGDN